MAMKYRSLLCDLRFWAREHPARLSAFERSWIRRADPDDDWVAVLHTRCEILKGKAPTKIQAESFEVAVG